MMGKSSAKPPYRNDLHGKKFNRLSVISFSHIDKNNGAMWNCECECGGLSVVGTSALSKGHTKSCGCFQLESMAELRTHGMTATAIYRRWAAMKARCKNQNNPVYWEKGISYDPRWESFDNFYEDMAEGFSEDLELDRIDVCGGYSKDNCRWVTHRENNYNKNKQSNNTSGKTGVSQNKKNGKFRAYITLNGRQRNLGVFDDLDEAIAARKDAELEFYGYGRP